MHVSFTAFSLLLAAPLQVLAQADPQLNGRDAVQTVAQSTMKTVHKTQPQKSASQGSSAHGDSSKQPQPTTKPSKASSKPQTSGVKPSGTGGGDPTVTKPPSASLGYDGTGCGDSKSKAQCSHPNGNGKGSSGTLTVTFVNSMDKDLSMSFGDNSGKPGPVGMSATSAVLSKETPYVAKFAPDWAGRVAVGHGINGEGTKFEGSNVGAPGFDISLVDGYTVPMVCSEDKLENPPLRGCNIDLFDQDKKCSSVDEKNGKICLNKSRTVEGCQQPEEFFHACAQSAYVFPLDDCGSVWHTSNTLVCCVGSKCPAVKTQKNGDKRSIGLTPDHEKRDLGHLHARAQMHAKMQRE